MKILKTDTNKKAIYVGDSEVDIHTVGKHGTSMCFGHVGISVMWSSFVNRAQVLIQRPLEFMNLKLWYHITNIQGQEKR